MTAPILTIANLTVRRTGPSVALPLLQGLSLQLAAGECAALCGPSGSGKTTACLAPFGLAGKGLIVEGTAKFAGGTAVTAMGKRVPGGAVMLFQEPLANFAPHLNIGIQLNDLHRNNFSENIAEWATKLLLSDLPRLLEQVPAQCSGGELQRLALLAALSQAPALLVADEPTSALDETGRAAWTRLVREQLDRGLAVLLVTHDEALLQALACRRIPLAPAPSPRNSLHYSPVPRAQAGAQPTTSETLLQVRLRSADSPVTGRDSAFSLDAGGCLALVGPSGGGKSSVLNLVLGQPSPVQGEVLWRGRPLSPWPSSYRRELAGRMAVVMQDARSGLCPHRDVIGIVAAAFRHAGHAWRVCRRLAANELGELGVPPETWGRRPATLSTGQAQRVALATAMAVRPALLVCDEPTSGQDASHRELVLRRLLDARERQGCAVLLATHDLELARALGAECLSMGVKDAAAG